MEVVGQTSAFLLDALDEAATQRLDAGLSSLDSEEDPARWRAQFARLKYQDHLELFELLWRERDLLRLLLGGGTGARYGYLIDELSARCSARHLDTARLEQAAGLMRPEVDAELMIDFIAGGFLGLSRRLVTLDERPDLEAWSAQIMTLIGLGLSGEGLNPEGVVRLRSLLSVRRQTQIKEVR